MPSSCSSDPPAPVPGVGMLRSGRVTIEPGVVLPGLRSWGAGSASELSWHRCRRCCRRTARIRGDQRCVGVVRPGGVAGIVGPATWRRRSLAVASTRGCSSAPGVHPCSRQCRPSPGNHERNREIPSWTGREFIVTTSVLADRGFDFDEQVRGLPTVGRGQRERSQGDRYRRTRRINPLGPASGNDGAASNR